MEGHVYLIGDPTSNPNLNAAKICDGGRLPHQDVYNHKKLNNFWPEALTLEGTIQRQLEIRQAVRDRGWRRKENGGGKFAP
jgi:hypothetical protein